MAAEVVGHDIDRDVVAAARFDVIAAVAAVGRIVAGVALELVVSGITGKRAIARTAGDVIG